MGKSYWSDFPQYDQPSAEVLRRRAEESAKKAEQKGKTYEPVHIQGRAVCTHWWGKAWCDNMEQYADYATRLPRGKRYVRTGTVIDLKVISGRVKALVQGTKRAPYKVTIRISPLAEEVCDRIIGQCARKIENMEALVGGEFPQEMKELFTGKDGLFPTPREISFQCSCPDWALMCKHVAAAMYGVGVRLDENPFYFFSLRGLDVDRFIDVTLENRVEQMLANADVRTPRVIEEADMFALFGIG